MPRLPSANDIARVTPQGTRGIVGYQGGAPERLMAEQSASYARVAGEMIDEQDKAIAKQADVTFNSRLMSAMYDPEKGYFAQKGKNAVDGYQGLQRQIDQMAEEAASGLNDRQRAAFLSSAATSRAAALKEAGRYALKERNTWLDETGQARINEYMTQAAIAYDNPDILRRSAQAVQGEVMDMADRHGWSGEVIREKMREAESGIHANALKRMVDADPAKAEAYFRQNERRMTGADLMNSSKLLAPAKKKMVINDISQALIDSAVPRVAGDDVIDFVMNDLEGGDKLITDSNGAATRFGINQGANPDQDVATLTADDAREVWRERYYKAIGGDELPADMRVAALSFAATSGVAKAKELMAAADGNVDQFIGLQESFYRDLAKKNPEKYGAYLDGWLNRLGKVSLQAELARGREPSQVNINRMVAGFTDDIEIQDGVRKQYDAFTKAKKADAENRQKDVLNTLGRKVREARNDWTVLTPSEIAAAEQVGVLGDLQKMKPYSDQNRLRELLLLPREELAQVDPRTLVADLSTDDLDKWQGRIEDAKKPTAQSKAVDKQEADIINQGWSAISKESSVKGRVGAELEYRESVRQATEAFIMENGRRPKQNEMTRIVQTMLLTNYAGDNRPAAFDLAGDREFAGDFSPEQVNYAAQVLSNNGMAVNNDNLELLRDEPEKLLSLPGDYDGDQVRAVVERLIDKGQWGLINRDDVMDILDMQGTR